MQQVVLKSFEVRQLLRVSAQTLRRWVKMGKITALRYEPNGQRRYFKYQIDEILEGKR